MIENNNILLEDNRGWYSRVKLRLKDLEDAISAAKDYRMPYRNNLLDIYDQISESDTLATVRDARDARILGLGREVINEDGSINDELTKLFNLPWFSKFLMFVVQSFDYGFSLIDLGVAENNDVVDVQLIPRQNVIPERGEYKKNPYGYSGRINYREDPQYASSLVEVLNKYDKSNLGDSLEITRLLMIQKELQFGWAQYADKFGHSISVYTTDDQTPEALNKLHTMAKNQSRTADYIVKDSLTQLDLVNGATSANNTLFYDYLDYINKQVSKRTLGATMLTEQGSSKSQAEVHQSASYLFTKRQIGFVQDITNMDAIPVLKHLGIIGSANITYRFVDKEILTPEQNISIDQFLLDNFNVGDIVAFENRYNRKLDGFKMDDVIPEAKQIDIKEDGEKEDIDR